MSHTLTLTDSEKVPSHGRRSERLVLDLGVIHTLLAQYPALLAGCGQKGFDLAWDEILLAAWASQAERHAAEVVRRQKHQSKIQPHQRLPGRNEPCPCGSGSKFKNCHGR